MLRTKTPEVSGETRRSHVNHESAVLTDKPLGWPAFARISKAENLAPALGVMRNPQSAATFYRGEGLRGAYQDWWPS